MTLPTIHLLLPILPLKILHLLLISPSYTYNDNKLYNIEYNTINYETKFQAKLVKNSIIDSISYNKKKKLAILNFNDKTQLEIERISAGDLENIINKGVK